jgi:hypothetical protein
MFGYIMHHLTEHKEQEEPKVQSMKHKSSDHPEIQYPKNSILWKLSQASFADTTEAFRTLASEKLKGQRHG